MPSQIRKLAQFSGSLLALGSVSFIAHRIWILSPEILDKINSGIVAPLIVLGSITYAATCLLLVAAWRQLLLPKYSSQLTFKAAFIFYGRTQINKYLPGNVFHILSRQLYSGPLMLSQKLMALLSVLEAIASAGAATLICLPLLASYAPVLLNNGHWVNSIKSTPLILAMSLIMLVMIPASRSIAHHLGLAWPSTRRFAAYLPRISGSTAIYGLFFISSGLLFYTLLQSISNTAGAPSESPTAQQVICATTAAWLAGYLIPGVPAGIGVREIALVSLLGSLYREQDILVAAVAYRMVTTLGDSLFFLMAFGIARSLSLESIKKYLDDRR